MSVMDKLINAMKFNDDEDYEDEEEYEDEDYYGDDKPSVQETKSTRPVPAASVSSEPEEDEVTAPAPKPRKRFGSTSSAIDRSESAATRQVKKQYSEAGMEVCIIKPTSVNDAREVTDTLLANSTVVLNLEGLYIRILLRSTRKCHEDLTLYLCHYPRKCRRFRRHLHTCRDRPQREQYAQHALRRQELIPCNWNRQVYIESAPDRCWCAFYAFSVLFRLRKAVLQAFSILTESVY